MEPLAKRRRTQKHDEDRAPQSSVPRVESKDDTAGPRRTDSPQVGVARLAEVAGNQAVAGMLQRDFEDEELDGAGGAPEPLVEQEEAPGAPVEQQAGGDGFVIGDNVDGGGG